MKNGKTLLGIAVLLIIPLTFTRAQNNPYGKVKGDTLYSTGWSFGLNLGAFWANKYQANFYNGASGNVDSINLIFRNQYYMHEIREVLNDTFHNVQLPADMRYQPAMMVGFHIKYNMTRNFGLFMQFNYQGLKAKDVFTIDLGPPGVARMDSMLLCPIWGKEDRYNIDIGLSRNFTLNDYLSVFAEGGMNVNYARVKEHKIAIKSLEYSLINIYGNVPYIPNTQMQTYTVHLGGWGIGGFIGTGIRFIFNNHISLDPGAYLYWSNVNLQGYSAYRPHFSIFVRFCYQNLVTRERFEN